MTLAFVLETAIATFLQNIRVSKRIESTVICSTNNNPPESIALGYIICDIIGTPEPETLLLSESK